ncbi:SET and MYND domain-containing protein 4 [Gamsiella multidivaricata]|nr:SET and MYND domain-containing protein 4 [Gamsiella multidivaricata]
MATMAPNEQHAHSHKHEHEHCHDQTYTRLAAALKGNHKALDTVTDKPVLECFKKDKLALLATQSNADLDSIKAAFTKAPTTDTIAFLDRLLASGLAPVPTIRSLWEEGHDQIGGTSIDRTKLDDRKSGKLESGTYVFARDEMPYACVIEKVWRGRRCEECLRPLPKQRSEIVNCPTCPTVDSTLPDNAADKVPSQLQSGPSKFCSHECLKAAWTSWHGFECRSAKELSELSQLTRLALRVYWQNARHGVPRIASSSKSLTSVSNDDINSLTSTAAGLSLNNISSSSNSSCSNLTPRITSADGSDILPSQLCHNFDQLDHTRRISFLMTGYYLQQILDLPEDATLELAHLQAMVQFNSFAIKTQISESIEGSDSMTHMNDYAIGSALYLLASMFNHSCAPNAMVVFGKDGYALRGSSKGGPNDSRVEISYGPQAGRMKMEERKECLRRSHLFECNCSACNDKYAEAVLKKIYKCPKNGYLCRPMTEKDRACPTCGCEIDMVSRNKMHQQMARLITESQDPSLTLSKRLILLKTLESIQSKTFVDTCILYGNTCDQLAMVYAESGDLGSSIEWCKKALKVVVVHFPHDSIEVAQETLKLAGLLFNNMQTKEAMKQVQIAITLYKGHYGASSRHPDLLELYEMERFLKPLV